MRMNRPILIGIAGGSASGKTSIAHCIENEYADERSVTIIRQDDYYKDQSDMTMEERRQTNYDHPLAFDNDLMLEHLNQLIEGNPIHIPTYDFVNLTRGTETHICYSADVIVVEGLFVLEDPKIRELLDIKVFVDTPADIRLIRRLKRDVKERGRTMDSVIQQYTVTVRTMHETFIEPSKRYADIIIPEGGKNRVAIDLLTTKISSIIHRAML